MNMQQKIGLALMASPFLAIAALCLNTGGWRMFAFVFGVTIGVVSAVVAGAYLLFT